MRCVEFLISGSQPGSLAFIPIGLWFWQRKMFKVVKDAPHLFWWTSKVIRRSKDIGCGGFGHRQCGKWNAAWRSKQTKWWAPCLNLLLIIAYKPMVLCICRALSIPSAENDIVSSVHTFAHWGLLSSASCATDIPPHYPFSWISVFIFSFSSQSAS